MTQRQLLTFGLNTEQAIKDCIGLLEPDNSIAYRACVGLMTRLWKLYGSISRAIQQNDGMASTILMRSFYETSLSLVYLLFHFKDDLFKEFVLTDAMRRRDLLDFLGSDKSGVMGELVTRLEKSLKDDGYDETTLPKGHPGSWHRKISYRKMAVGLGDIEAGVFSMAYGPSSRFVHPSWSEIMDWHLKESPDYMDMYVANLSAMPVNPISSTSMLICISLTTCEIYAQRFNEGEEMFDRFKQMHSTFHREFDSSQELK